MCTPDACPREDNQICRRLFKVQLQSKACLLQSGTVIDGDAVEGEPRKPRAIGTELHFVQRHTAVPLQSQSWCDAVAWVKGNSAKPGAHVPTVPMPTQVSYGSSKRSPSSWLAAFMQAA